MDRKTHRTGQEQFASTANHWTKVVQLMYSIFTRKHLLVEWAERSACVAFARLILTLRRCRHLLHASRHLSRVVVEFVSALPRLLWSHSADFWKNAWSSAFESGLSAGWTRTWIQNYFIAPWIRSSSLFTRSLCGLAAPFHRSLSNSVLE